MKICRKCKLEKEDSLFCKHKASKDGLYSYCRACQVSTNKQWRYNNPAKAKAACDKWRKGNPDTIYIIRRRLSQRFSLAKSTAKRRGFDWSLTKEQFAELTSKPCEYCRDRLPSVGSGLDRKDSKLGYHISNVVPCCTRCNKMKNAYLTYDEMLLIWNLRLGNR